MLRETHLPQTCLLSVITHLQSWFSTNSATITSQRVPKAILGLHTCSLPSTQLGSSTPGMPPLSSHLSWASDRLTCLAAEFWTQESQGRPHASFSQRKWSSLLPPHNTLLTHASPCLFQSSLLTVLGAVQAAGGVRGKPYFCFKKEEFKDASKSNKHEDLPLRLLWHFVPVQRTHCITTGVRHSSHNTSFSKCG